MPGMTHECGIYGSFNDPSLKKNLYEMGVSLQHRGQEAAGICVDLGTNFLALKGVGLADTVIPRLLYEHDFKSDRGFGHNRYSTQGRSTLQDAQPIRVRRIAVGHNGTLVNTEQLRKKYGEKYNLKTDTDSELIACIFEDANADLLEGAKRCFDECIGSYNLLVMNSDGDMAAIRDPWGYHPLHITQDNDTTFVASEDVAFFSIGQYKQAEEVRPGEAVIFKDKDVKRHLIRGDEKIQRCFFEPIYFMAYGSTYKGRPTKLIREELGKIAARKEKDQWNRIDAIGKMRDSGTSYAAGYSMESGIPTTDPFNRNRSLGRIYMTPEGKGEEIYDAVKMDRKDRALLKNVPIPFFINGQVLKIPDDSFVRGNTTEPLTRELYKAGAAEVHWVFIAPPIKYPCFMGMDHATRKELAVAGCSTREEAEQVATEKTGATSVRFLDIDDLKEPLNDSNDHCWACLTGEYAFEIPPEKLKQMEL